MEEAVSGRGRGMWDAGLSKSGSLPLPTVLWPVVVPLYVPVADMLSTNNTAGTVTQYGWSVGVRGERVKGTKGIGEQRRAETGVYVCM